MKLLRRASMLSVVAAAAALAGCTTAGGRQEFSLDTANRHMQGYRYVLVRDLTDIYRSFDRHFFNYDWDDPNLPN